MKSERRHDLEKNELAARIANWLERITPYTSHIVLGGVLLVVLYVGYSAWSAYSSAREQAAWDAFTMASYTSDRAMTSEMNSLLSLADDEQYAGTSMQEWAYLIWADRQVFLASRDYLVNREAMRDRLTRVLGIYQQLSSGASERQVQDRAYYGLGQVYEMQNKLEEAREAYAQVRGDVATLARERAEQLDSPRVQEATAWLATAELPRRQTTPDFGSPPPRPDFGIDAPVAMPPAGATEDRRTLEEILMGIGADTSGEPVAFESPDDVADEPAVDPVDDTNVEDDETTD